MANQAKVAGANSVVRKIKKKDKAVRKIHKAEREKLKRDHLNELFTGLSQALEPSQKNNGKASILADASRILRGLLTEIDHLRQENAALLAESHYIAEEKNELIDEKSLLEAEINKLQSQLKEPTQMGGMWTNSKGVAPPSFHPHAGQVLSRTSNLFAPPIVETHSNVIETGASTVNHVMPSIVGPAELATDQVHHTVVRPSAAFHLCSGMESLSGLDQGSGIHGLRPHHVNSSANVTRPHARYPTPSDFWPSLLLTNIQGQFLPSNG